MTNPTLLPLLNWARKLRYPTLFKVTCALFLVDLVVPDFIPFVDEILLGLGTLLLANWKERKTPPNGVVVDSTATRQLRDAD